MNHVKLTVDRRPCGDFRTHWNGIRVRIPQAPLHFDSQLGNDCEGWEFDGDFNPAGVQ
jgi:hypothetical protein